MSTDDTLTRPTRSADGSGRLPMEALVDTECGIIRSVRQVPHPPGAPTAYQGLTAAVADARQLGEWPADRVSLGTAFNDAEHARIAAIASAEGGLEARRLVKSKPQRSTWRRDWS